MLFRSSYKKWETPLKRKIDFPRLVMSGDLYDDRSLEDIISIEVTDPFPLPVRKKLKGVASPELLLRGPGERRVMVKSLEGLPRREALVRQVGDGKGYHGSWRYEGVPLSDVLKRHGIAPGFGDLLLITSPDGYRSLISYGELVLTARGREILLADRIEGGPPKTGGRFCLVLPGDLSADRWVKAVERIEVHPSPGKARLRIIGVGSGDTALISLQALSAMGNADAFICPDDIRKRFAPYMGGKPVLYDPLLNMVHYYHMKHPALSMEECRKKVADLRESNIRTIRDCLKRGKTVAFLDYGDPTIYGSWTYWLYEHFLPGEIEVVPGISAFNAANALIGKNLAINGSVVITVPDGLSANEDLVKGVARNGDTLAIFVGLKSLKKLMPLLRRHFREEVPVIVAYRAGYSRSARLVRTDLKHAVEMVERDREQFLGIVYIGESLKEGYRPRPRNKAGYNPL